MSKFFDRRSVMAGSASLAGAAATLIQSRQYSEALALLEQGLMRYPASPALLEHLDTVGAHAKTDARIPVLIGRIARGLPDDAHLLGRFGRWLVRGAGRGHRHARTACVGAPRQRRSREPGRFRP